MSSNGRKADSRTVDTRRKALLESAELLRKCGLEIDGELKPGNCSNHLLPVLYVEKQKNSGTVSATGIQVGAQNVRGNPTDLRNWQYKLSGDSGLLPFPDPLFANPKRFREGDLPSEGGCGDFDGMLGLGHEPIVTPRFTAVNSRVIARAGRDNNNQLMVYSQVPDPSAFKTFRDWLKAVTAPGRYLQTQIASFAGTTKQTVTKWLKETKPGKPSEEHLKGVAAGLGVEYVDLHRLVHGIDVRPVGREPSLMTKTESGARAGRIWEDMDEPDRSEMLSWMERTLRRQKALRSRRKKPTPA